MSDLGEHDHDQRDPYALLTRAEVAELLRCTKQYVTELTRSGKLYSIRVGRRVLVPRSALEAFIRGESWAGGNGQFPQTPSMFDE